MRKIGILTLFQGNRNWGGALQAYALKTLLESNYADARVDLLLYRDGYSVVYPNRWRQMAQYTPLEIIRQGRKRLAWRREAPRLQARLQTRNLLFVRFEQACITNTRQYTSDNLMNAAREYDCLICGSDQIWNPNVARPGFFLTTVAHECVKIAYAASIAREGLSLRERAVMMPLIARFDAISVREKTAKVMLESDLPPGHPVVEALDPALMLPRAQWEALIRDIPPMAEKYALAFFFADSLKARRRIGAYCEANGLALKTIPFAAQQYIATDDQGDGERQYDVGPREFVRLLHDAQCVFTDSFHGAVFSILFQKPFCVFERDRQTKVSKNVRLYDLLEKFGLSGRLIDDGDRLDAVMRQPIDFGPVQTILHEQRERSLAFLTGAISKATGSDMAYVPQTAAKQATVASLSRDECVGCGACAAVCPAQAIAMQPDAEGFAYPALAAESCTRCGLCLRQCVGLRQRRAAQGEPKAYLAFHRRADIRKQSSSGGLFYALASNVLAKGGAVYGAALDETFCVRHIRAASEADVRRLMASKYVQSDLGAVYAPMLEDLKAGVPVLFCGTPCQVGAMRRFVRQMPENQPLFVDFVCHGVPSPEVWQSYLRYLRRKGGIASVQFRSKEKGWHDYHFAVQYRVGKRRAHSHERDPYMRAFLSNRNLRPSCYACAWKGDRSEADITLADAWKIEKEYPAWADDRGTSLLLVHTEQGAAACGEMAAQVAMRETDCGQWREWNPSMVRTAPEPAGRRDFFRAFLASETVAFWRRQSRMPLKMRARCLLKAIARKAGLSRVLRRL